MRLRIVPTAGLVMVVAGIGCGPVLSNEDVTQLEQGITGGTAGTGSGSGGAHPVSVVADTMLDKTTPDTNHGADPSCTIRGGSVSRRHCLLRWDLSSIPTSTVVNAGTLTLKISDTDRSTSSFIASPMVRSWSESGATWNIADVVTPWEIPGASGTSDSGSVVVATLPANASGFVDIPVSTALLQQWVNNPNTNRGIVFGGGTGDGVSFSTREATGSDRYPPRLTIYY
jgi:hypothetical protein